MSDCRWKLVAFDWDGTMMDTAPLIIEGIQYANAKMGYRIPSTDLIRECIGLGREDTMHTLVPECPENLWSTYEEIYRDYYICKELELGLFDGLPALLNRLQAAGVKLAIATGKSERGLKRVFAKTGVGEMFCVAKAGYNSKPKPAPDMLFEISREANVALCDMVMVGDGKYDLLMAKNAGVDAIGVLFGACTRAMLEPLPHVALVDSIAELEKVLFSYRRK